jgi:hypothetical protein
VPAHWRSPSTGLGRSCSDSLSLHTRRDITIITKALEPSLRTTHVARPASLNLTTQDSKPSDAPHDITASSARQILVAILRMHMSSAAMMPLNAGISARHLLRLAVLLNGDHPPDNRRGMSGPTGDLPQVYKSPQPIQIRARSKHLCHTIRGAMIYDLPRHDHIFLTCLLILHAKRMRLSRASNMLRPVSYSPIGTPPGYTRQRHIPSYACIRLTVSLSAYCVLLSHHLQHAQLLLSNAVYSDYRLGWGLAFLLPPSSFLYRDNVSSRDRQRY